MKKQWLYLVNTFEVNTRNSKVKMLRLANFHDARLNAAKSDPLILELYTVFHAALLLFQQMLAQLTSISGTSIGKTQSWTSLLDEMAETWFNTWQVKVFYVFPKGSPQATAIFPNGKTPFISTKYDERMVAVEALLLTLAAYPELADVSADVAIKYDLLKEARQNQVDEFGKKDFSTNMIENQRIVLADLMDDDLCRLKVKYRSNPKMVENFFDLGELRKPVSDFDSRFVFTGTVEAGATSAVMVPDKLVLSTNAICSLSNRSNQVQLEFFFSANASSLDNPNKTLVMPNERVETTAAELGWAPGNSYIIIKNPGNITAEFDLSVMESIVG